MGRFHDPTCPTNPHTSSGASSEWGEDAQPRSTAAAGCQGESSSSAVRPRTSEEWREEATAAEAYPEIIHLDFFSGAGSASLALRKLGVPVRALLSWEVDPAARAIAQKAFQGLRYDRGDFTQDEASAVATLVRDTCQGSRLPVLITAGPPCPDYSKIKSHPAGRDGSSGGLFVQFTQFLAELEAQLSDFHCLILVENVHMANGADIAWFSHAMKASPILADAADYGLIARPRLWWSRVNWTKVNHHPEHGGELKWTKQGKVHRLKLDVCRDEPSQIAMKGLSFHPKVNDGSCRLPCLTTPAPDSSGREAPRSMKGRLDSATRGRWLQGARQYAPWHYADTAMVKDAHNVLQLLPAEVKEQLHHFDVGFTSSPQLTPRDRHRLLGNSWHVGVAKILLALVLAETRGSSPIDESATQDFGSTLKEVTASAKRVGIPMHKAPELGAHILMMPAENMLQHWEHSQHALHPLDIPPVVDPAIEKTACRLLAVGAQVSELRTRVLADVRELIRVSRSSTEEWFKSLPPHVQDAYRLEDGRIVQIPVFIRLLQSCNYEDCHNLQRDLSEGFPLLGELPRSPGWQPRTDEKYQHPIDRQTFAALNFSYVCQKLAKPKVDPEWRTLLEEITEEVAQNRMQGPFTAPSSWPRQTVAVPDREGFTHCRPLLDTQPRVAGAFSVVQMGSDGRRKVRRCEGYRRSHHNSTIKALDVPAHDTVDTYVQLIRFLRGLGLRCTIWCQDLWAAYRQYPVARPDEAYVLLQLPHGPSLWRHSVLPFGSSSSVWCFNRCTDALLFLGRCLLLCLVLRFVDDIGSPDAEWSANSSFSAFSELCELLGLRLKPSKAQPPSNVQKLLGVTISVKEEGIVLEPTPQRIQKVRAALQQALASDSLTPEEAARITGKINFLNTTMFGQLGASAMQPLYARARDCRGDSSHSLNGALRSALTTLNAILANPVPRVIPYGDGAPAQIVLYADAFFELGDSSFGLADNPPEHWSTSRCRYYRNGLGFVLRTPQGVRCTHTSVPAYVLSLFSSRRAYIYALEILAQLLGVLTSLDVVRGRWIGFIDNTAGRAALNRGYGRDPAINHLLAFFWAFASRVQWSPHFEWVPSELNVSDPISRGDWELASRGGWSKLDSPLEPLWRIFAKVAGDLRYAVGQAVDDVVALQWSFQI